MVRTVVGDYRKHVPAFPSSSRNRFYEMVESFLSEKSDVERFSSEFSCLFRDSNCEFTNLENSIFSEIDRLCDRVSSYPEDVSSYAFYISVNEFQSNVKKLYESLGRWSRDIPCEWIAETGSVERDGWIGCPNCRNIFSASKTMEFCPECWLLMNNPFSKPKNDD